MLKSTATLKERFAGWLRWDEAMYAIGANLGFWPEFGAPHDNDPWHGRKELLTSNTEELALMLECLLDDLVRVGCLEGKDFEEDGIPTAYYRWDPEYNGVANG